MKIKNLEELRKIHAEIKERNKRDCDAEIQKNEAMLEDAVKKIIELNMIARLEGLLALEEAVEGISRDSQEEELKQLIILIVDGTDPDIIQGIGMTRYYVNLYTDYQALRAYIYLEGTLSIQAGENPIIVEEKLKTMLPPHMYQNYTMKQEQIRIEKEKEDSAKRIENLCKGERLWNSGENGYYVSKLLDYVLGDMSDKSIQRVLRDVDNCVLAIAMKGMSGDARRRIFDNLSERLGKMLAEDMTYMGPVRIVDIVETSQTILSVIIRLVNMGELVGNYEYLEPFMDVFQVDTKTKRQKNEKISELRKIVEEYEQGAGLVKEITDSE